MMRENGPSPVGKLVVTVGILVAMIAALTNILRGEPQNPLAFGITAVGFVLFLIAKLSVVRQRQWISFGTKLMSPGMANAYRVGYWLIIVGILATFV
jgi:hypothetical protein